MQFFLSVLLVKLIMSFWYLNRQVSIEEGDAKSRESRIMFIETSAKAGFNIKVKINEFSESLHIFLLIMLLYFNVCVLNISIWKNLE